MFVQGKFAWFESNRRLSKDFDFNSNSNVIPYQYYLAPGSTPMFVPGGSFKISPDQLIGFHVVIITVAHFFLTRINSLQGCILFLNVPQTVNHKSIQ